MPTSSPNLTPLTGGRPKKSAADYSQIPLDETTHAEDMVRFYGPLLRDCEEENKLIVYEDGCWKPNTRAALQMAEATLRIHLDREAEGTIPGQQDRAQYRAELKSHSTVQHFTNMITLARTKVPRISINDFDANPWQLNVENGTINLQDGTLQAHNPDDLCRKKAKVCYDPFAQCPDFLDFLNLAACGGPDASSEKQATASEIVDCLQLVMGAAATGEVQKILLFLFGTPGGHNGKTTFLEACRNALGDLEYSTEMQIGTLMRSSSTDNTINADIARLKGMRLVTCSEPEKGQELSVNRVKYLTGGGKISGRYLAENQITFSPTHTTFIDFNTPPVIPDPEDAIWNRVKCIPFFAHIAEDWRARLAAELPGILAWIVRGAVRYHKEGLWFPKVVNDLTETHRRTSNHLPVFFNEVVRRAPGNWTPITKLRTRYEDWCRDAGEKPIKEFEAALIAAGFVEEVHRFKPKEKYYVADKKQIRSWASTEIDSIRRALSLRPEDALITGPGSKDDDAVGL